MASITSGNAEQYGDSRKLAARARLNSEYTIAETGWFPWIASQLSLKPGDRILDVGCGPGWFWEAAATDLPQNLYLTLTDLSPGMVLEAVERCRPLPFASVTGRQADAAALPFEDESFDTVIAMHMLYHLPAARATSVVLETLFAATKRSLRRPKKVSIVQLGGLVCVTAG